MITFNVQAHNDNFYRGHRPANGHGNCWSDERRDALVFTIDQARKLVETWPGRLKIVIAIQAVPMNAGDFERELFCAGGGNWYHWPHRDRLRRQMKCCHGDEHITMMAEQRRCDCGAVADERDRWYDPASGTMLDTDLVLGNEGTVVSICDDLETFCDELGIEMEEDDE